MTDEELIARLRYEANTDGYDYHGDLHEQSADRIEALTKERDDYVHKLMQANNTYAEMHVEIERLSDKLETCEKYRDAYAECDRIGTQAVRDLEAKLAKAVEALEKLARLGNGDRYGNSDGNMIARATLAEIKGESHE